MKRPEILNTLNQSLQGKYPPDVVERVQSMINGTLAELDALPPYPDESEFQSLLTDQVYPFLAAAQSLAAEDVEPDIVLNLVHEVIG